MKQDITWWKVIAVCILIAGVTLTIWSAQQQDQSMRNDLLLKTNLANSGIAVEQVTTLNGSPADLGSPEYQSLKLQLGKIRASDPDIRFAYLMSRREDGSIILNADSEPPESADYSPPGQVYSEAPAAVRSAFATGEMANEGPYTDRWGTWVSGFIPVTDPSTGRVVAVFGMDTDARDWNSIIFRNSLPLLIATLLIVLLVMASAFFQRRNEEEKRRLETSEEKFSKAFHANPALVALSTIDEGRILDVNESFLSKLGYSREEVTGTTTSAMDLYVDPEQRNTILKQVRETGQVHNMEVRLYRKNRDLLYGSLTSITIDVAGTPRLFTAILDLTERKRAEEAVRTSRDLLIKTEADLRIHQIELETQAEELRKAHLELEESRDKFLDLYEFAPLGYFTLSDKALITGVNLTGATLLGTDRKNLVNTRFRKFIVETDSEQWIKYFKDVLGQESKQTCILTLKQEDGSIFPARLESIRLTGTNNSTTTVRVAISDISDIRFAEEVLRESEEKYRHLIENSHDIIYTLTAEGVFIFVSPAWTTLLGHPVTQVTGQSFQKFVHPDDIPGCMAWLQNVIGTGQRQEGVEYRVQHTNGSWYWHTSSAAPFKDETGKIVGFYGIARDITERKQAEEALRQLSDRLSLAARAGGVGIWDYDVVNNTLTWDDQMFALYGITREQFGGAYEAWQTGLHPDDKQRGDEEIQMALREEKEFDTEFRVLWPDGSIRNIRAFAIVQRDAGGKPLRMIGTNWDITERRRAEEEVIQTRRNFEVFFNTIDEFLYVLDEQGRILHVNETVIRRLGYTKEELSGQSVLMVHPPERRDEAGLTVQGMLAGTMDFCPVPVMTRDGHLIPVETRVVQGEWDGSPVLFGVSKDISDLKVSEEKFSAAFHSNAAAMAVSTKHDGKFVDVNAAFLQMLGFSRDEVIGKSVGNLHLFSQPENRIHAIRILEEGGVVRNLEVQVQAKDGSALYGLFSADSITIGEIPCLLTTMVDITERKNLEEEMKFHEQELTQFSKSLATANRKLNLLSSITRHDINNQLTVQMGYLEILEDTQLNPSQDEYFMKISTAAKRISAMIRFTKEYEEIGVHAPSWQEVHALVETAAKQAPLGAIMVKNDLPAGMEVFADPLIVKVCYNLMDNAARYGGKITTIRFFALESGDNNIIVCEDDGDGIPVEEKEKIFERGFGKNTGLGLFLSREILDITGITITETGEPGKGARFEITVSKGAWRMTGNDT